MLRRFLVIFLCLAVVLTKADPLLASDNLLKDKMEAIDLGGNQEAWLDESFSSNVVTGVKALYGKIEFNDDGTVKETQVTSGILGITSNLIASLYTPPASGINYIAHTWNNFLGRPAYAQGIGFNGLEPLIPIWRGFRNVVYTLSSLVFIVIGIMIMLRVKISPQAVITIQNAIPKLITTLILVTFSYAIAGLLIDVLQLLQSAVLALLFSIQGVSLGSNLFPGALSGTDFTNLSVGDMGTVAALTYRALPMTVLVLWGMFIGGIIGAFFTVSTGGWGSLIGAGIGLAAILLIVGILMLIWMFKFYFGCLKCYVTAIFQIITAPFAIGIGAFPQAKTGFSDWLWNLLSNLAVFPISIIFLVLGNIIIESVSKGLWAPHIIKNLSLQSAVVIGSIGNVVTVGLGLSVVMLLSKLPEMVPQFIFMIKPSPWGQAIGQGMNESMSPVKSVYNTGVDLGTTGLSTGVGPLRNANAYLEGLNPGQGVPKQVAEMLRGMLRRK